MKRNTIEKAFDIVTSKKEHCMTCAIVEGERKQGRLLKCKKHSK